MRISDCSSDVCSSDLILALYVVRPFNVGSVDDLLRVTNELSHLEQSGGSSRSAPQFHGQIGRASCRERVCQYVSISVVAVSLKNKTDLTYESKYNPTQ